jgi:hypothetical protein
MSTITRNSNFVFSLVSLSRVSKLVSKNDNIARKFVDIMENILDKLKCVLPFLTASYTSSCSRQQMYEKNSIAYCILKNNFMDSVGNIIFFVENRSTRLNNMVLFLESVLECLENNMSTSDMSLQVNMCLKVGFPLACKIGQVWDEQTVREHKYINVVTDLLKLSTRYYECSMILSQIY